MENVKFTKGPWKADYQPSTGFGCGYGKNQIIAADGQAVAGVAAVKPNEGEMYRNGGLSQEAFDQLEANAALIAAAPELYEACKAALSDFEELVNKSLVPIAQVHPFTRTPEMLRAAIAKAGGNHER